MALNHEIINPRLEDNSIGLSFGTQFKIRQVFKSGHKSDVNLITNGFEDNVFIGLFDSEDIDFEIVINNELNPKAIKFGLNIGSNEGKYDFILRGGLKDYLESLETNGKRLHFLSQTTDDGKVLVAMSALNLGLSYTEASVNCSRIGFTVEVERQSNDYQLFGDEEYVEPKVVTIEGHKMDVFVQTLGGKIINVSIGGLNTVKDLMHCIYEKESIPLTKQYLIYRGMKLENEMILNDYDIKTDSIIHVLCRLRGGGDGGGGGYGLTEDRMGERGVVCFGDKTKQRFGVYDKLWVNSKHYVIKPFTIELRMKPKYSLN